MKDQACSDFVFIPLPGDSKSPTPTSEGRSVPTSPDTDSQVTVVKSKIVVVGDCSCGKSSLIKRYCHADEYSDAYTPTGFDTFTSTYDVSDTYRIQVSIWDTSGDEGYDRVRPLSYTDADLIICCFSVANPESMENVVSKWVPEVREYCPKQPLMLVGCKTDLRKDKQPTTLRKDKAPAMVSYDQGLKTAKHIGALVYSETSSKTSQRSVNDVMEVAALSSAGTKGNTAPDTSIFRRHRSFISRKRFSGMNEAKVHLRKEAAKSCIVM